MEVLCLARRRPLHGSGAERWRHQVPKTRWRFSTSLAQPVWKDDESPSATTPGVVEPIASTIGMIRAAPTMMSMTPNTLLPVLLTRTDVIPVARVSRTLTRSTPTAPRLAIPAAMVAAPSAKTKKTSLKAQCFSATARSVVTTAMIRNKTKLPLMGILITPSRIEKRTIVPDKNN